MIKYQEIEVSIIVPCFNQAQYLDKALKSVLHQSFSNWECIIVDDDSPDNTKEISKSWCEKDSRFKYVHKLNGGLASARNYGIAVATGTFILPLDADDYISNDYLELALLEFEKNNEVKIVYALAEKFGVENGLWQLKPYTPKNMAMGNVIYCSALFRKSDWKRVGGYDETMKNSLTDWEFWIHILKPDSKVKQIKKVCFYYRIKERSMIKDLDWHHKKNLYEYVSVKHADFFVLHLGSFYQYMREGIQENNYLKSQLRSRKHALKLLLKPITNLFIRRK